MATTTLHLNGSRELDLLLGFLHLPPKAIDISKKKQQKCLNNQAPALNHAGVTCSGLITVTQQLIEIAEELSEDLKGFIGSTPFEKAEIRQWLHYCETDLKPCGLTDLQNEAERLNKYIANYAYFVGNHFTLVDLVLFQTLHPFMAALTFADKEKFVHLSRWFDQVQNIPGTRHRFPTINFHMTKLY